MALAAPSSAPSLYAGVPAKRLIAWVIDIVVVAAMCLVLLPFTFFTGILFFPFLMLVVGFFYRWFSIANRSSTWGMRMMAIELRDLSGQRLDSGSAFLHTAGYTFSFVTAPLQVVSVAMMVITDRGQGLTDLVLGTTAVNKTL